MMPESKSITEIEVGTRIRALRQAQHDSQEKLAQALNVSRELISKIESGGQYPSVVILARLSEYFSIPSDYILFGNRQNWEIVQQLDQIIVTLKALQRKL